ncbi:unnamed protein product [Darwinula stevensoni]|uniref:Histone acetyltransferase n=1 Tax=Darwinula stevensoni TaxID=69355 RepID=A0A7R8X1I8_9CRUS|nr:unnamed protein product [Darwinula stevensoni]CAG0880334.1 unnamed protein product [Darwinula stevensoni]
MHMSSLTGVNSYDLVSTMQELGIIKYWKGKHIILRKQDLLEEHREKMEKRKGERRLIDPTCLRWRPYQAPNPPPSNS